MLHKKKPSACELVASCVSEGKKHGAGKKRARQRSRNWRSQADGALRLKSLMRLIVWTILHQGWRPVRRAAALESSGIRSWNSFGIDSQHLPLFSRQGKSISFWALNCQECSGLKAWKHERMKAWKQWLAISSHGFHAFNPRWRKAESFCGRTKSWMHGWREKQLLSPAVCLRLCIQPFGSFGRFCTSCRMSFRPLNGILHTWRIRARWVCNGDGCTIELQCFWSSLVGINFTLRCQNDESSSSIKGIQWF